MTEFLHGREIFFVACAFYSVAFGLGVFSFFSKDAFPRLKFVMTGTLLCGWVLQFSALYIRGAEAGTLPLHNTFELLQTLGWSAVFAMGFLRIVWTMRVPALLTSGLALGLSGLGMANALVWDVSSELAEKNLWVSAHALLVIVGYAFWTASALVWIAYILQDRALRKCKTNRFYAMLPDLSSLDRVAGRLVACGIISLIASVVIGALNLFDGNTMAPLFVIYKISVSAVLICGNAWLMLLRRKKSITGRAFARRGLAVFVVGVILLGGFTCVRTATDRISVPADFEMEGSENVR